MISPTVTLAGVLLASVAGGHAPVENAAITQPGSATSILKGPWISPSPEREAFALSRQDDVVSNARADQPNLLWYDPQQLQRYRGKC
jgi:hypothetical protein